MAYGKGGGGLMLVGLAVVLSVAAVAFGLADKAKALLAGTGGGVKLTEKAGPSDQAGG